jgi:hypothetical protein
MGHPLVRLAAKIDWGFLDRPFGEIYAAGDGQPPVPVRLIAGLFILKHMHSLSDDRSRSIRAAKTLTQLAANTPIMTKPSMPKLSLREPTASQSDPLTSLRPLPGGIEPEQAARSGEGRRARAAKRLIRPDPSPTNEPCFVNLRSFVLL